MKVEDLTETVADKKMTRLSGKTKSNPNKALIEAQPGRSSRQYSLLRRTQADGLFEATLQENEVSTLVSLGTVQYKDSYGNVIGTRCLSLEPLPATNSYYSRS